MTKRPCGSDMDSVRVNYTFLCIKIAVALALVLNCEW